MGRGGVHKDATRVKWGSAWPPHVKSLGSTCAAGRTGEDASLERRFFNETPPKWGIFTSSPSSACRTQNFDMWPPCGALFDPYCALVDSASPHWWTEERLGSSLSFLKPLRSPSSSFGTLTRATVCDDFAPLLCLYLLHPVAK